mgnify:CR=1 FL=1
MRRQSLFVIVFTFLLISFSFTPTTAFAEQADTERMMITFKNQIDEELLKDVEIHHLFPKYHAAAVTIPVELKEKFAKHGSIAKIEPDAIVTTNAQIVDWGFKKVEAVESHKLGLTGKGVKIGIVDSGIDAKHPDLKITGGVSFVGSKTDYRDTNGHGTHVAGVIGARDNNIGIIGVAPEAELYAIKVIGESGLGNQSDVVQGIEWAMEKKLDILNLSITTTKKSTVMEAALNDAYQQGLILVAASGNSLTGFTEPVEVLYPARFSSVIAVGAVDQQFKKASFSYYGNALEFVAPGTDILSTVPTNLTADPYATSDGTSMAAPFVSGIAALYKEAYPQLSNKRIRTLMQTNSIDLGPVGKDRHYGYGLIQAPKTVKDIVFADVATNAWHEQAIMELYNEGILSGYPDGNFYPNKEVTRAEAITMISRTLNIEAARQPTNFKDVPEKHFASGYIAKAAEKGIVSGYPDGRFAPNTAVIRADTAVLFVSAFELAHKESASYPDVLEGKYYTNPIYTLKGHGIASGFPNGTYQPMKQMTRAEFAVLLSKLLEMQEV